MAINVQRLPQFAPLYDIPEDTSIVIMIGGRGGAKTYEASKAIAFNATVKGKRVQILRDEKSQIKETILNETLLRYDTANQNGAFDGLFERLDTGIKNYKTGEMVVFTKGFRASSTEKKANLKGGSNIDIAVVEEAEDIRDEDKFNTFADSIRKKGSYIIIILNTPDIGHWIVKRFFNLVPTEHEGYYDIEPKVIPGFICIKTGYRDNPFLDEKSRERYNGYGDPEHYLYNKHHFLTAIKGYASTGRKGQYFTKYNIIPDDEFNKVEAKEIIVQDFGTKSPAGMLRIKMIKNDLWADELNYLPLALKEIAFMYCDLGFNDSTVIIADNAEPETIGKLRRGIRDIMSIEEIERYPQAAKGFPGIRPVHDKSINNGINVLLSLRMNVTQRSTNLFMEFANYCEAVDRNNVGQGVPIDGFNHLIDPLRYGAVSKGRVF